MRASHPFTNSDVPRLHLCFDARKPVSCARSAACVRSLVPVHGFKSCSLDVAMVRVLAAGNEGRGFCIMMVLRWFYVSVLCLIL